MLILQDVTLRMAGRLLIDKGSATIPDGAKIGLVGRNGSGKTTLFSAILGQHPLEEGDIAITRGARIGHVAQEAPGGEESLLAFVLAADRERARLLAEAETAEDAARIAAIQARLIDIDAHSAEARAARILAGLGFDARAQNMACTHLSGGWRMRLALAAALFAAPDLLLLDEPTNYLDLEGTLWLTQYLKRYPHTVLLISHDRDLLDAVADHILHLYAQKLKLWRGGYSLFEKERTAALAVAGKEAARQEARRRHLQSFIDRFRAKASKAKQAQSRIKALEKMQGAAPLLEEETLPIRLPDPASMLAPPILRFDRVSVGYDPAAPVLKNLSFRIDPDDRIALLGKNGNGKSTLAKLIGGRLDPFSGSVTAAPKLKIGYFAQHQLDELDPAMSASAHLRHLMPEAREAEVRARVAQMGLATPKMDTPAGDLSGGERARLLLGLACFEGPHLLILDEPTNHLDIESRRSLIDALNGFEGAVILISHDRHLLEACADRLWLIADGRLTPFEEDLAAYERYVLAEGRQGDAPARAERASPSALNRRQLSAQRRAERAPLRQKIRALETAMDRQRQQIARLDAALADPALYATRAAEGVRLARERAALAESLERMEEEWLALSLAYETENEE